MVAHFSIISFSWIFMVAMEKHHSTALDSERYDVHLEDIVTPERLPEYPYKQYIQTRRSYSEEHGKPERHSGKSHGYDDFKPTKWSAYLPILTAEESLYKKQQVYEEKGFSDKGYDHMELNHDNLSHPKNYQNHPVYRADDSYRNEKRVPGRRQYSYTHGKSLRAKPEASNILKYIEINLHDKDVRDNGIYKGKSHIYCPPFGNFPNKSKNTLGVKIDCLKERYFGKDGLEKVVFPDNPTLIEFPKFTSFYKDLQKVKQG